MERTCKEVEIEKLVFGGQGLGRDSSGRVIFCWNALPGERVLVDLVKKKRTYAEGIVVQILKRSPDRQEPVEDHFLSCSPWQILTEDQELWWKREITKEVFRGIGALDLEDLEVYTGGVIFGYRNKMEFSFTETTEGLCLGFFKRGSWEVIPVTSCHLAQAPILQAGVALRRWLKDQQVKASQLKSLILRSNQLGEVIAGLFVSDPNFRLSTQIPLETPLKGFSLFFSDPRTPASVPTALLSAEGEVELVETVLGKRFRYGLLSFFQINLPVFEQALKDMEAFVENDEVVDYYSGVGSIGIALSERIRHCVLVESDEQTINFARQNILLNDLGSKFEVRAGRAEKLLEEIQPHRVLILDPPRAGLHPKVVQKILKERPKRLLYLSCNPSTQARDVCLLSSGYRVLWSRLYNFFPRTPHLESLLVLDRKE